MSKIGFIGCGNMGGALLRAAVQSISPKDIYVCDLDEEKLKKMCSETGANPSTMEEILLETDMIYLGVKPQVLRPVLQDIKEGINREKSPLFVSMAAGVAIASIQEVLGNVSIIRIMPNLPAAAGEGMILYASENASEEQKEFFLKSMEKSGKVLEINEKSIDAGSAVSGCGPAFVFQFLEAMADGGVRCGLKRQDAELLAAQTILGSAKLFLENEKHPGEWKDAVCSPGGTTIEGVLSLEKNGFRGAVSEAVIKAYEKTLKFN